MKIYEPFLPPGCLDAAVTRGRPAANLFSELCFRNGDSIMDICTFKTILFLQNLFGLKISPSGIHGPLPCRRSMVGIFRQLYITRGPLLIVWGLKS